MKKLILILSIITSINCFSQNSITSTPGIDIIGKSYNIFGEYANANSLKSYKIFDFSKVPTYTDNNGFTLPNVITLENISDHKSKSIEGTSASEYIQKLSANAGLQVNAFVFKGSFDASFNQNNSGSSYNYFYSILDENYKWRISLETRDVDYLISILDPLFVKDIQTLSPADFFKRYGSHIVVKGYLGGRAEFSMKSNATEQTVQKDLKMQLDARYVNVKAQGNLNTNSLNYTQNSNTQTQTRIIGGNSEYANNLENPAMYQKWVEGIKNAPVLCDFDEESLMPIWLLTKNLERQKALEDYFNNVIVVQNAFAITPGLHKHYVFDDFSTPIQYKNLNWELIEKDKSTIVRDYENKELDVKIIDSCNIYAAAFPGYAIDLRNNYNYYFEIENKSNETIEFIIKTMTTDVIQIYIDPKYNTALENEKYKYELSFILKPFEKRTISKGSLNKYNIPVSGTFINGFGKDINYDPNKKIMQSSNEYNGNAFLIWFTFKNIKSSSNNKQIPSQNINISIKNLKIGL